MNAKSLLKLSFVLLGLTTLMGVGAAAQTPRRRPSLTRKTMAATTGVETANPAHQAGRNFGVGAMVLGPTGLSLNYRFGHNSIDAAFAWNMNPGTTLYVHSTYLFRYPGAFQIDKVPFLFYWGAGPRIYTETKDTTKTDSGRTLIAARAVAGLSFLMQSVPVEFFGEFAFAMNLSPSTSTDGGVGLGARYYF